MSDAKPNHDASATTLVLKIGRRETREVADLAEASAVYQQLRDASGEGGSTWPDGRVGKHTISYNGRVWIGDALVMEATVIP